MARVLTGSDALALDGFRLIDGLRVGFIGNHTSRLFSGEATHHAIAQSGKAQLAKLFSPEHGAFGAEDHENVADAIDRVTGLPIHSLYGSTRKPTPEMLDGLDALIFELQDVGARFYTYASTMLLCMDAAAEAGIPLIVLDRPNPLGGSPAWEGPLPDSDKRSFVVSSDIPVRHGLTIGEIALIDHHKRNLADGMLQVLPCANYFRNQWWDEMGLPWTAPSPAMRSPETAIAYPGVCLLEQTNISVGRGTDAPFLISGAPWVECHAWTDFINEHAGFGIHAQPCRFTPNTSKFTDEPCEGVRLSIENRNAFSSVRLGIVMICGLLKFFPDNFEPDGVNILLASDLVIDLMKRGASIDEICGSWLEVLQSWRESVTGCLLYP